MLTPEQKRLQEKIFRKNVGFGGFSEIHGIHVFPDTEVVALAENIKYQTANVMSLSDNFQKLKDYRFYILSLDTYGFRGDFFKIQSYREGFSDMNVEELLDIFNKSEKEDWEQDREYYFALFGIIEDKLEEKGISLGFGNLFELGL